MLHMLYDIGAMGLLGHKLSSNSREAKNLEQAIVVQYKDQNVSAMF